MIDKNSIFVRCTLRIMNIKKIKKIDHFSFRNLLYRDDKISKNKRVNKFINILICDIYNFSKN